MKRGYRLTLVALVSTFGFTVAAQARQAGSFAFAVASVSVNESGGAVQVSVQRTGGSSGVVSVDIASVAGTATGDVDYESNLATLAWNSGDAADKTFSIALIQDTLVEGPETFELVLSNPQLGATLGSQSRMTVTIIDDDSSYPPCSADPDTLCLRNDRFEVAVEWRSPPSFPNLSPARVAGFQTTDSGLFYFVNPNNLEFLIKVLNGCGQNGHYWVFFAATTAVEFTVTVTDTEHDVQRQYTNAQGHPANAVTDVMAFSTCP